MVCQSENGTFTFGMNQQQSPGILLFKRYNLLERKLLVYMAGTVPQQHIAPCNAVYIITQVLIWPEYDFFILRKTFHYLTRIGRSNHYIRQSLDGSCSIYIRYNRMTGMLFDKFFKFVCRTTVGQRTACIQIGNKHFFIRTDNFCRLSHKMHTAQNNYISFCFGSPLSQSQTVSYIIGNILNGIFLIVMSQNNSILFFAKLLYLFYQIDIIIYRDIHISNRIVIVIHNTHIIIFFLFFKFKI